MITPRRIVLSVVAVALCGVSAAPALADQHDDTRKLCVALSNDPEKQDYAPVCVWVPIGK